MDTDEQVFEIDWQKLTLDELKAGYLRQSDYTKKTQELASKRKELENIKPADLTDAEKNMLEWIKKQWFVSKDELEKTAYQQTQEIELRELITNAPQLKSQEAAIRRLQQVEWWSYEEIIQKYGFMDADKLVKAKESRVRLVGEKDRDVKAKNIADLSPEEYEKWKKENLNNGGRFNKSRTI
jgi:ribosomal protein S8